MRIVSGNRNFFFCTGIFLLLINFSIAQETTHLSLPVIFQKIETSYPEILMYDSKIKSIQAQSEGTKAWMPPAASFGFDRFPYDFMMLNSKDDPMNQAGLMFSIEQMIPNSAKLNAKQNYFKSLSTVQQNNAGWTKNILTGHAKLLYYQRYISEKKSEVIKTNMDLLNLLINTAQDLYKYDQSDLSTIYKAQAKLKELQNMQSMLFSEISESNIGLNILMNRDISTQFSIDTIIPLHNYETEMPDTSLLNRDDIASMESSIQSMKLRQTWMASEKKPDFGVKVQHMQMFGMPNQFSAMGMITFPFAPWSSKMYKSDIKSMGFEIDAMRKETETMKLMALQMIQEKRAMLKFEKEQLNNYETEIIPAYQKNMETSLLAYKQNTGSFFVLLDAWDMLLMKQMEYLDKMNEVLKLEAEYEYEIEKK